jgi:hypothetical protein
MANCLTFAIGIPSRKPSISFAKATLPLTSDSNTDSPNKPFIVTPPANLTANAASHDLQGVGVSHPFPFVFGRHSLAGNHKSLGLT